MGFFTPSRLRRIALPLLEQAGLSQYKMSGLLPPLGHVSLFSPPSTLQSILHKACLFRHSTFLPSSPRLVLWIFLSLQLYCLEQSHTTFLTNKQQAKCFSLTTTFLSLVRYDKTYTENTFTQEKKVQHLLPAQCMPSLPSSSASPTWPVPT